MTTIEHYASNAIAIENIAVDSAVLPDVDQVVSDLLAIMRKHTKTEGEGWSAATTMTDAGIDSFDFVELVFEIEDKYDINMNFNANMSMEDLSTVGDIARLIVKTVAKERKIS